MYFFKTVFVNYLWVENMQDVQEKRGKDKKSKGMKTSYFSINVLETT